jgi:hypothetical protein
MLPTIYLISSGFAAKGKPNKNGTHAPAQMPLLAFTKAVLLIVKTNH